jgi:hypothetical protein
VTLSDKLRKAQTERMIAAGLLPGEAALKPDPNETPVQPELFDLSDPIVIESPAAGLHPVADPPPAMETGDGGDPASPSAKIARCPTCHRPGTVDMVDLVGHTTHMTCPTCRTMWQVRDTTVKYS